MYVAHDIKWSIIFRFAWKFLIIYIVYSTIICFAFTELNFKLLLPALPISILGVAVAFYVGFKNNSSYDRLWEARRIWGSIVNQSRTFGIYVLDYIEPKNGVDTEGVKAIQRDLIMRHLAYINTLRVQLRRKSAFSQMGHNNQLAKNLVNEVALAENLPTNVEISKFLDKEEAEYMAKMVNAATQLLRKQSQIIAELNDKHLVDKFGQVEFGRIFASFYDQQGACERIKTFPYPRQYAYFSKVFVIIFILLLPFALVSEFYKLGDAYIWLTIPVHTLVSWVFVTMELVGDNSENPFENGINDIPMTAICRTIEIDLRQMLGETNLPPRIEPVNDILM
jgi:ion channel-forming bestrophin family protein